MTPSFALGYVRPTMHGLYAIVDAGALDQRSLDPLAFAEAVLRAYPAALQLRAKNVSARETLALLRALAPMCHRAGVLLVANDRPDLAILAGCDLVHVGQDDMPVERVRRIAPGLGIGVSTHTLEQLDTALAMRPTYVAYGPVFSTTTKINPDPVVGVAGLGAAYLRARAAGIPLVAIGGITYERGRAIVAMADAVAAVADLLPAVPTPESARTASDLYEEITVRAQALSGLYTPPRALAGAGL
ncbi:MAG TPA: thiamine phosphate synthase [Polyangiaceae bacterium]|nr:thiamine phosphate synthase [Polyangiaceae bacterium]